MSKVNWTDDKLLSRLLNSKSGTSRWANIRVLRGRPSEELFAKCVALTKSDDPKHKIIAIDILSQLGVPSRPYLQKMLKLYFDLLSTETHPDVLRSILYAIGHNNSDINHEQVERLCSFINNENNLVREGLTFALLGINDLKVIDALIELSADRLSKIKNWATFGLASQTDRNNKAIRDALWNRVNDKHQETKLEAIFGLAKRKDDRVKDIIIRELTTGEYGSLLLKAIIETEDERYLPLLRQNLKNTKADADIDPEWLRELEECVSALSAIQAHKA
ncbi:hypothetical protein IM792_20090 [Mucilaginibacter sp. JRF]|uniref:hypothetical protein n=1 Tax=Mucilaginibacter sp. JRF TaxID=2780088 RepID=UPI001882B688|nr:hypothetical protein [Mucilaginibacter sp. JRF]MBE9586761.1 hypothetical protein [Mucilaginibacter sp. JRF]